MPPTFIEVDLTLHCTTPQNEVAEQRAKHSRRVVLGCFVGELVALLQDDPTLSPFSLSCPSTWQVWREEGGEWEPCAHDERVSEGYHYTVLAHAKLDASAGVPA